ncbi:outer membrane beta-barrel protein [Thioclava sp. GXIMD4216]|uniref:Outer membrane beta-barrel protein n=1 Tax=Thioclava litoralis TaxID=3076557 RepID=A0ABZ1DWY2_9RHOB|nr:outer membrane beta-barrel protein [Thioclava sp. FTW29]
MKTLVLVSTALIAGASAAMAGGYSQPVVAPAPIAPAPVVTPAANWTGFYAGANLGYNNMEGDYGDDRGGSLGVQAGYKYDLGKYVVGGEVDYSAIDSDYYDGMGHIKALAGVKNGQWLYYGSLGGAYIDGKDNSDWAPSVSAGVDYMYNDNWVLGGEVSYADTNDFDSTDRDFNNTTVALKASYKF